MSMEERLEEETLDIAENDAISPTPYIENNEKEEDASAAESDYAASDADDSETDYARIAEQDMAELRKLFPALGGKTSITELDDPVRYAALRDLGLTPKEAYLATSEPQRRFDNRSHLTSAVPHGAGGGISQMSARELDEARELFSGLSDREIRRLYKKVTK